MSELSKEDRRAYAFTVLIAAVIRALPTDIRSAVTDALRLLDDVPGEELDVMLAATTLADRVCSHLDLMP